MPLRSCRVQSSPPRFRAVRRGPAFALLVAASLLLPTTVRALSLTPTTLALDSTFTSGDFQFLGMQLGLPDGGVAGFGSVGPTDVTFLFAFSVDADSDFAAQVAGITPAPGQSWTAAGYVPGPGAEPHSVLDFQPQFVGFGIGVLPGQSTSVLFVSAPAVALGAEYAVSLGYSSATAASGTVSVVPEPGSALLVSAGLVALAQCVRRSAPRP